MLSEAFIYDAIRTPRGRGRAGGALYGVKPITLLVDLLHELQRRNPGLDPARIEDVILGVVSPVGDQGGVIPRAAAVAAGRRTTSANGRCSTGSISARRCTRPRPDPPTAVVGAHRGPGPPPGAGCGGRRRSCPPPPFGRAARFP